MVVDWTEGCSTAMVQQLERPNWVGVGHGDWKSPVADSRQLCTSISSE